MAFPAVSTVIDDFDRADGTLQAGAGATIWTATALGGGAGAINVESNRLAPSVNGANHLSVATLPANFEVFFDVATASTSYVALFFSLQSATGSWEGYWLIIDAGLWMIKKRVGGVTTDLVTVTSPSPTSGDKVGLRRAGSAIEAYRYTAGAWNQTPIASVADSAIQLLGPFAFEVGNAAWRLDNLVGAEVAPGGADGPLSAVTIYVDASHVDASDAYTRGQALDPATPLETPQRAAGLAKAAPAWADTILVKPSPAANPLDASDESVYPRMVTGHNGAARYPFANNAGNLPILLKGDLSGGTSVAGGSTNHQAPLGLPKIAGFDIDTLVNWHIEDIHFGYTYGSGFDVLNISSATTCTDITWKRCVWTGGAYSVRNSSGLMYVEDCEWSCTMSIYATAGGRTLDGTGWKISNNSQAGDDFQGTMHFKGCDAHHCSGDDMIQVGMGTKTQAGVFFVLEDCYLHDSYLIDGANPPHTDCLQILGGPDFTVQRNKFERVSSPIIASDYLNGTIRIFNNLILGAAIDNPAKAGLGITVQGTDNLLMAQNTVVNSGFGVGFLHFDSYPATCKRIMWNNVFDGVEQRVGVVLHDDSEDFSNVISAGYGDYAIPVADVEGVVEFGTSPATTYELATLPTPTPGYHAGTADVRGPLTDRIGRTYGAAPNVGCHADAAVAVTQYPRGPLVLYPSPARSAGDVSPLEPVGCRLYALPGTLVDVATIGPLTFYIHDPGDAKIPGTISVNAETGELVIVPAGRLIPYVAYTAIVKGGDDGAADAAGRTLGADYTWTFTVGQATGPAYLPLVATTLQLWPHGAP